MVRGEEVVQVVDVAGIENWDLHPDGRRYVLNLPLLRETSASAGGGTNRFLLLENWFAELARLTSAPDR